MKFINLTGKILIAQVFCVFCLTVSTLAQTPKTNDAQTLTPNQIVKRDLRGGEKHSLSFAAKKGEFVRVVVSQQGVDAVVKVFAPDNAMLFERDTPNGAYGDESVSFVASADGNYRLEVSPLEEKAFAGKYEARLEARREAKDLDLLRVKAETEIAEATRLRAKNAPDANKEARTKFEEAVKNFQTLNDKYREANTLSALAFTILDLGEDAEKSLQMINRALALAREISDRHLEKMALVNLGDFYLQTKNTDKAVEFYNQGISAAKNLGDKSIEIIAWQGVGNAAYAAKQWQKSIDAYQKVLALHGERGDREQQAQALDTIGFLYGEADDRKQAGAFYEQTAAAFNQLKNTEKEAQALENAGYSFYLADENEKALAAYQKAQLLRKGNVEKTAENLEQIAAVRTAQKNWKQAAVDYEELLALYRALKNDEKIAATLNLIGVNLVNNKERQKAIAFYDESRRAYQALKKQREEIVVLENIATNYFELKDAVKTDAAYRAAAQIYIALGEIASASDEIEKLVSSYKSFGDLKKAIAVYEEIPALYRQSKDKKFLAVYLNRIGVLYSEANDRQKARQYYQEALKLAQDEGNKSVEAQTRYNLGAELSVGGKHNEAIAEFQKALALRRELKLKIEQGEALERLAQEYGDLRDFARALASANEALEIFRQEKSRANEASALVALGGIYESQRDFQKSKQSLEDALKIAREIKDKNKEAAALHSLSITLDSMGDKPTALEYDRQAAKLFREAGDLFGVIGALDGVGKIYEELGDHKKSLETFLEVLAVARKIGSRDREGLILARIGGSHFSAGDDEKGLRYSLEALPILRETGDKLTEITTLINVGNIYSQRSDYAAGEKYLEQALVLARELGERGKQSYAVNGLALISYLQGENEKSFDYLQQALILARAAGNKTSEASILGNLMISQNSLNNGQVAIFYGKQAVNIKQEQRAALKGIDKELQQTFLKENEAVYRKLADLLIKEGRIMEAQAVLDLLKEEELGAIARRSGEPIFALPYSRAEEEAIKIVDRLANVGREIGELKAQKKDRELTATETERLNLLEFTEIPAANKALRQATEALATTAPDVGKELDRRMKDNVQNILPELGGGVVALYTVFGQINTSEKEKTNVGWILLVTPEFRKAYPIDTKDLNETVVKFRNVLRSDASDPQPLAQEIYKKLFLQTSEKQKTTLAQDLETYLAKSPDKTLMWSLDGVLRYVPMAALHDGKTYLVEKYRNVVFNTASLGSLKDATKANWEILGLGVSESKTVANSNGETVTFAPLKGAETELRSLVKEKDGKDLDGIMSGTIKLNKDFTKQALFSGVREGNAVVHIASHFSFNTAKEENSFLLLGDGGKLEMNEFQDFPNLFAGVDLLSLSACDTATGGAAKGTAGENANGKEVEGFAYVAQTLGAKSVMASLWQVSDEGTKELMLKFYETRKANPNLPKGEALRQAQFALLRGNYKIDEYNKIDRSEIVKFGNASAAQPPFKKDEKRPFAHPYYWSPFILIGNWK